MYFLKVLYYVLGITSMLQTTNASVFVKLGDDTVSTAKNLGGELNDKLYQFDDDLNFFDRKGRSVELKSSDPALSRKLHFVAHGGATSYKEIFSKLYDTVDGVVSQPEVFLYGCNTARHIESISDKHSDVSFTATTRSISHDGVKTVIPTKADEPSSKICKSTSAMHFPCKELDDKDTVLYQNGKRRPS